MIALLAQQDKLSAVMRAIRQRFQDGGSIWGILVVAVVLVVVVWFAHRLTVWTNRKSKGGPGGDGEALFRLCLGRLGLSRPQRQLLRSVAHDSGLDHPTVLLLSRSVFDDHVARWQATRYSSEGRESPSTRTAATLRTLLFPG